jgi:hypothetical protein
MKLDTSKAECNGGHSFLKIKLMERNAFRVEITGEKGALTTTTRRFIKKVIGLVIENWSKGRRLITIFSLSTFEICSLYVLSYRGLGYL